jgi:hypothetical protein
MRQIGLIMKENLCSAYKSNYMYQKGDLMKNKTKKKIKIDCHHSDSIIPINDSIIIIHFGDNHQYDLLLKNKEGKVFIDTFGLGKEFAKQVLCKLIDEAEEVE